MERFYYDFSKQEKKTVGFIDVQQLDAAACTPRDTQLIRTHLNQAFAPKVNCHEAGINLQLRGIHETNHNTRSCLLDQVV